MFTRLRLAGFAVLVLALVACGGTSKKPAGKVSADLTEEELFQFCKQFVDEGKESEGRGHCRRYEQRYPRGPHIEEVKLLIADSFFNSKTPEQRIEGVQLYRQFLTFYPQHELACIAQLRISEYYMDQMRSCERDQSETRTAVDELQKLLAVYPDCSVADVARENLALAYNRLACAEYKVAQFYNRTGKTRAAEHRLHDLLRDFPKFELRCTSFALYVEVLDKLGDLDGIRTNLAKMEAECKGDIDKVRGRLRVAPVLDAEDQDQEDGNQ